VSQAHPVNSTLEDWNRLEQETAMHVILPCNGSRAWATGVVNRYPFDTPEQLFKASDEVWLGLGEKDWQQAFDSHPRIGEHKAKAATAQSAKWSEGEQSAAETDSTTTAELANANRQYETKFGRIFLICATGKTSAQILAALRLRLLSDPTEELREAVEQQRRITQLRLRKWLQLPAADCESV
jgi:2-oxo-4-hydroxy-4-carboxy-5-ureidoimidazoline decarboxylase